METSTDTSEWQRRYDVIEKAYCEGRWSTVMEAGTHLLRELLSAGGGSESKGLRYRMQLLMAHTLLHGYGDRDAAEDIYEVVRQSDAESALRQIAEDGLDQCHQPLLSPIAIDEGDEGEEDAAAVSAPPMLFLPEKDRTDLEEAGDLADISNPPPSASQLPLTPLVTIPSEPEVEPQALPFTVGPPVPQAPVQPSEGATMSGMATDPFSGAGGAAQPASQGTTPVMPWLSEPLPPSEPLEEAPTVGPLPWLADKATSPSEISALVPDVVEEPELVEVHQSLPWLAEEVDIPVKQVHPVQEISPVSPIDVAEEDGELRTGLLLVVVG